MSGLRTDLAMLIERGGWVMLPLLVLSVVSIALIVERIWFWATLHRPARIRWLQRLGSALRTGDRDAAARLIEKDRSPYSHVGRSLLEHGAGDAVAVEVVELQRPKFDRFMVSLSTIITAAPLLGILGTVIGIIRSFRLLGGPSEGGLQDPSAVSMGIAEALLTTAMGLVVALVTLFPYMIFRSQAERAIGRVESVIAAAQQGASSTAARVGGSVEIETRGEVRASRAVEEKAAAS
ncbi:MAG: MotA/TolQ/ExbB proton channel family protein [Planctomycetota bacterium]